MEVEIRTLKSAIVVEILVKGGISQNLPFSPYFNCTLIWQGGWTEQKPL
jgi:hypothetical protein